MAYMSPSRNPADRDNQRKNNGQRGTNRNGGNQSPALSATGPNTGRRASLEDIASQALNLDEPISPEALPDAINIRGWELFKSDRESDRRKGDDMIRASDRLRQHMGQGQGVPGLGGIPGLGGQQPAGGAQAGQQQAGGQNQLSDFPGLSAGLQPGVQPYEALTGMGQGQGDQEQRPEVDLSQAPPLGSQEFERWAEDNIPDGSYGAVLEQHRQAKQFNRRFDEAADLLASGRVSVDDLAQMDKYKDIAGDEQQRRLLEQTAQSQRETDRMGRQTEQMRDRQQAVRAMQDPDSPAPPGRQFSPERRDTVGQDQFSYDQLAELRQQGREAGIIPEGGNLYGSEPIEGEGRADAGLRDERMSPEQARQAAGMSPADEGSLEKINRMAGMVEEGSDAANKIQLLADRVTEDMTDSEMAALADQAEAIVREQQAAQQRSSMQQRLANMSDDQLQRVQRERAGLAPGRMAGQILRQRETQRRQAQQQHALMMEHGGDIARANATRDAARYEAAASSAGQAGNLSGRQQSRVDSLNQDLDRISDMYQSAVDQRGRGSNDAQMLLLRYEQLKNERDRLLNQRSSGERTDERDGQLSTGSQESAGVKPSVPIVRNAQDYREIEPGSAYIGPDGQRRRKPAR